MAQFHVFQVLHANEPSKFVCATDSAQVIVSSLAMEGEIVVTTEDRKVIVLSKNRFGFMGFNFGFQVALLINEELGFYFDTNNNNN